MLDNNTLTILHTGKKLRNKLLFDVIDDINYYSFFKTLFNIEMINQSKLNTLLIPTQLINTNQVYQQPVYCCCNN